MTSLRIIFVLVLYITVYTPAWGSDFKLNLDEAVRDRAVRQLKVLKRSSPGNIPKPLRKDYQDYRKNMCQLLIKEELASFKAVGSFQKTSNHFLNKELKLQKKHLSKNKFDKQRTVLIKQALEQQEKVSTQYAYLSHLAAVRGQYCNY